MRGIFRRQLVAALIEVLPDPAEATTRAGLIATQMLGLALCRHIVRFPPVVAMDEATIVQVVGSTVQRYLTADLKDLIPAAPRTAVIGQDVHECDDQETTGPCAKGFVASADGTRIGYRQQGSGPGVVLLRGGVNASQHLMPLGSAFGNFYEVTCPPPPLEGGPRRPSSRSSAEPQLPVTATTYPSPTATRRPRRGADLYRSAQANVPRLQEQTRRRAAAALWQRPWPI